MGRKSRLKRKPSSLDAQPEGTTHRNRISRSRNCRIYQNRICT
jgi:hypothetical protein